jgi:hypothetical protein
LDLLEAARSVVCALIEYHRWHFYNDGTATMSYYPDSDDEVVNTGAEAALLLAVLPPDLQSEAHADYARGLFRMVLAEQRDDGLWNYVTRRHAESKGASGGPDNHHNAMILTALAESSHLPVFESADEKAQLRLALERGMESYLSSFVDATGRCYLHPGRRMQGGVDDYTEGLRAMLAVLKVLREETSLYKRISTLIPHVLDTAVDVFYDEQNGKVGTYRRFGKTYFIGSIGYGSGSMMEAIASVLLWQMTSGPVSADTKGRGERRA